MISRRSGKEVIAHDPQLIDEFKAAQTSIALIEHAKANASQKEESTLSGLHLLKSADTVYVQPADIPEELRERISYESLNAHFQKVQAMQIENHSTQKFNEGSKRLEEIYAGKKVTAKVLDKKVHPVAIGLKPKGSAKLYYTSSRASKITGIIIAINLLGNTITLRPTTAVKLFNRSIKDYQLYVINPYSLEPLISLSPE